MAELSNTLTQVETNTVTVVQEENASTQQVFGDEHINAIGLVQEVTTADGATVRVVGPPVEYSESVNRIHSPPPLLGQHTAEVLSQVLGYPAEKIMELQRNGHIV